MASVVVIPYGLRLLCRFMVMSCVKKLTPFQLVLDLQSIWMVEIFPVLKKYEYVVARVVAVELVWHSSLVEQLEAVTRF